MTGSEAARLFYDANRSRRHGAAPKAAQKTLFTRDLGFSLDQVRTLLKPSDERSRSCKTVDEIAKEHLAEVERKPEVR